MRVEPFIIARRYTYKTYYGAGGGDTSLTVNIFYYLDTATNKPTIGSATDTSIASIVIAQNGNNVTVTSGLAGVTTYSGATTGSTGATASSGSGPASALVTDTAGKSATVSLPNPPVTNNGTFQTFYGSNTGLLTNLNWFVGTDGNLYLDGVTDTNLASAVVTRSGLATLVSLIPNSTYK